MWCTYTLYVLGNRAENSQTNTFKLRPLICEHARSNITTRTHEKTPTETNTWLIAGSSFCKNAERSIAMKHVGLEGKQESLQSSSLPPLSMTPGGKCLLHLFLSGREPYRGSPAKCSEDKGGFEGA